MFTMSKTQSMLEKAAPYDKNTAVKHEVELALCGLKDFRQKYPFTENLRTIEWLDPDKLFKLNPDEIGEFFRFIEIYLKQIGPANQSSSNVYRNARLQMGEFKKLLRTAVDDRKSLAQKVDAPWERIGGLGQDKVLAKRIIYCFNYEGGMVMPIFSNQHMRHFVNRVADTSSGQTKYFSLGQEYQHYTEELLKAKNSALPTKGWNTLYFTRFLYATYPPPDTEPSVSTGSKKSVNAVTEEQLDLQGFMKLLGELQKQGKIDGERFRENRSLWTSHPSEREGLTQRLKRLLEQKT